TEPFPNCFSIALTASSMAFSFSAFATRSLLRAPGAITESLYRRRKTTSRGGTQVVPSLAPPSDSGCGGYFWAVCRDVGLARFQTSVAFPAPIDGVGFVQVKSSPEGVA